MVSEEATISCEIELIKAGRKDLAMDPISSDKNSNVSTKYAS
jgi:hypothetical protein